MPIRFVIDDVLDLVYLDPRGNVATRQFVDTIAAYAHEPGFHPAIDVLIDFRGITALDLGEDETIDEVVRVIQQTREGQTNFRVAFLVRTSEEETLVSIGGEVLYVAGKAQSFYDPSEALRWLERPGMEERVERLRRELYPAEE